MQWSQGIRGLNSQPDARNNRQTLAGDVKIIASRQRLSAIILARRSMPLAVTLVNPTDYPNQDMTIRGEGRIEGKVFASEKTETEEQAQQLKVGTGDVGADGIEGQAG